MKQYPKVRRATHRTASDVFEDGELVVLEKLDGNNFRFWSGEDGSLRFGSRTTKLGGNPDDIGGQFDDVTDFLAERVDRTALADLERELGPIVCFGENMVEHTLSYDWERVPQFLGFDVWLADQERFADWDHTRDVFETLGVPTVPEVERISADEFPIRRDGDEVIVDYEVPSSAYRDGTAEGVVLRNDDVGGRAKIVTEEFRERHDSASDGPDSDAERLAERYCTEARVRKAAHRLVDEGEYDELRMPMMEDLPMTVVEDIWAEEHAEIARTDWILEMPEVHDQVARRCVPVLKKLTGQ